MDQKEPNKRSVLWRVFIGVGILSILLIMATMWRNYSTMAVRAKRSEAPHNLQQICEAEKRYFDTNGVYAQAGLTPQDAPSKMQRPFTSPSLHEWQRLGWAPEGDVRCQYAVHLTSLNGSDFQGVAKCDTDGDGLFSEYMMDRECNVTRISDDGLH